MLMRTTITVQTQGRGIYDFGDTVAAVLSDSGATDGLCHLFCQHTSASMILCENYDPSVKNRFRVIFI